MSKIDLVMLEKLYTKENFSTRALADLFEVNIRTIQYKLKDLGIDLVKDSEKKRDKFGRIIKEGEEYEPLTKENNGNYKGGISIYRKIVFEEYKIPEVCFHCKSEKNIVIHHMDKNRYNNDIENLRPVCHSCHMRHEHPESIIKARETRAKNLQKKREMETLEAAFVILEKEIKKREA